MFSILNKYKNLIAVISEKKDGSMKLLPEESVNFARNMENRKKFLHSVGVGIGKVISAEITHGNKVEIAGAKDSGKIISGADGLLTNEKGVFLSVTVADCLPIFLYEPEKQVFGLLHAGWRGLEKNIIGVALEKMKKEFGCAPENILAVIGPAICRKHFEVGEGVAEKFKDYKEVISQENGKIFLDLKEIAKSQLINEGVSVCEKNIAISPECVYELPDKYFSYRRDREAEIEAMMAVIGIKD